MSEWTKYWQRIDNTPGSLERLTPEQLSEVRQMVKAAFHAGHSSYQQRIEQLERDLAILNGEWEDATKSWQEEVALRQARLDAVLGIKYHTHPSWNCGKDFDDGWNACRKQIDDCIEQALGGDDDNAA